MDPRTRNLLLGLGGGIAAAAAYPIIAPVVKELARPVTKALLRGGLLGLDYARTGVARLSEAIEDVVAEVTAEVKSELANRAKATAVIVSTSSNDGPSVARNGTRGPHSVS